MVGVIGEAGEVLAVRERGGNARSGRSLGSFTTECINAIPQEARPDYQLWVRSDSAGYQHGVIAAAERANAVWSATAKRYPRVNQAIYALATDPGAVREKEKGARKCAAQRSPIRLTPSAAGKCE